MAMGPKLYDGARRTTRIDFPHEGPFYPKTFKFNAGEVQVSLEEFAGEVITNSRATVTARIKNSDDLMELIMVTDAIYRLSPLMQMTLVLPYLPYSRQDRVANHGEALSAKVFADMINALNFKKVFTYDAHSDVSVACLNNCESYPQSMILDDLIGPDGMQGYTLISPDAGAAKKTLKLAQHFGGLRVIQCDKTRDTTTGEITGTYVNWGYSMTDMRLLIVDDICDGGMTFIKIVEAVQKFRPLSVDLYTTHGIYSKGVDVLFDSGIGHLYTTDSFDQLYHPKKTVHTL